MTDEQRSASVVLSADTSNYSQQFNSAVDDTNKLVTAVDTLQSKVSSLNRMAGKKLQFFGAADLTTLGAMTAASAAFERQMSTLNATSKITGTSMSGMSNAVRAVAKDFPIARGEVVALATELTDLAVKGGTNVEKLARTFVKLGGATGENIGSLAQQMIELGRSFNTVNPNTMDHYANSLLTVSKAAGVSASSVLSFSQAIAPIARVAGMTEQQVIGVSTAFTKMGQDGYRAANAFNTVLSDITRLTANGSPELAKYANLLGVTAEQFKKMDPAQQFVAIIKSIGAAGPDAIKVLDSLGMDGVTASKTFAALAANAGELQKSLKDAGLGFNNTKNLDEGSGAAFKGLADSAEKAKTSVSDLSISMGQPLLTPLTKLTDVVGGFLSVLDKFAASPIGKVALAGGALAIGAGSVALGAAMMMFQKAMVGATAGYALKSNFGLGARDAIAGRELGKNLADAERIALTGSPLGQAGYQAGKGLAPVVKGFRAGIGGLAMLPGTAVRAYATTQQEFLEDSMKPGYQRSNSFFGPARQVFKQTYNDARSALESDQAITKVKLFTDSIKGATIAVAKMEMTATRAAASAAKEVVSPYGGTSGVAAGLAGSTMRGLGKVASLAFNPYALAAEAGASYVYSTNKGANDKFNEGIDSNSLMNIYASNVGEATTKLGDFSAALDSAIQSLPKATASDVGVLSANEAQYASSTDYKSQGATLLSLMGRGGAAAAFAGSQYQGPQTRQQLALDIAHQYGGQQGQKALSDSRSISFTKAIQTTAQQAGQAELNQRGSTGREQVPWYTPPIMKQILQREGTALSSTRHSQAAQQALQTAAGEIEAQSNSDAEKYGLAYAERRKREALDALIKGSQKALKDPTFNRDLSKTIEQSIGISDGSGKLKVKQGDSLLDVLNRGSDQAKSAGRELSKYSNAEAVPYGTNSLLYKTLVRPEMSQTQQQMGRAVLNDKTIQGAYQNPGDTNQQFNAINALQDKALRLGGSFQGAQQVLQDMKASIGDVNNQLYKLADAAQQFGAQLHSVEMASPQYNSHQRFQDTIATNTNDLFATGPDASQKRQTATVNIKEAENQQAEQFKALYIQARDFNKQMARAGQDYHTEVSRASQDFYTQQSYATADFYKQQHRSVRDFNKQMARSSRDFNISTSRSQRDFSISQLRAARDFNKQMARAAEDAAQSIYDPYKRVQSQYTWSAGGLLGNLQRQTGYIAKQNQNLKTAQGMGLSKQAVTNLDLTNTNNSQQLDRLVKQFQVDPQLVQKFNDAVQQKINEAGTLTNSDLNVVFRRAREDFLQSGRDAQSDFSRSAKDSLDDFARMAKDARQDFAQNSKDAEQDFATSQARAIDMFGKSMARMSEDYSKMIARARQDLKDASTEIVGDFTSLAGMAVDQWHAALGPAADALIAFIKADLDKYNGAASALKFATNLPAPGTPAGAALAKQNIPAAPRPAAAAPRPAAPAPAPVQLRNNNPRNHALGVIALNRQMGVIGEGGPEAAIPLNGQGAAFMAATMKQAMLAAFATPASSYGRGSGSTFINQGTTVSGPITVEAQDPNEMARKLAQQKRLVALRRPATVGTT